MTGAHRPGPGHANPMEHLGWVFLRQFTSPLVTAWVATLALVVAA